MHLGDKIEQNKASSLLESCCNSEEADFYLHHDFLDVLSKSPWQTHSPHYHVPLLSLASEKRPLKI